MSAVTKMIASGFIADDEIDEIEREAFGWVRTGIGVDRSRLAVETILRLVRKLRATRRQLAEYSSHPDQKGRVR